MHKPSHDEWAQDLTHTANRVVVRWEVRGEDEVLSSGLSSYWFAAKQATIEREEIRLVLAPPPRLIRTPLAHVQATIEREETRLENVCGRTRGRVPTF